MKLLVWSYSNSIRFFFLTPSPFYALFLIFKIWSFCNLPYLFFQKRDSGLGALTSSSEKSSGIKSMSTPSTPQAESNHFHTESRLSHSLLTESSPSVDPLSEARDDREIHEDNFLGQETPLVCN